MMKIPLTGKTRHMFQNIDQKNFFKINAPYIRSIAINILQPNNEKVYFEKGYPSYLKFGVNKMGEKDFFYLNIDSKPTQSFPNNTRTNFQIELMKEYFLQGMWEVSVINCFIPCPRNFVNFDKHVYRISPNSNYFSASFITQDGSKKSSKLEMTTFTKRELAHFLDINFAMFFDTLIDQDENIHLIYKKENKDKLVQIFTSVEILEIINVFNDIKVIPRTSREVGWADKFKEIIQKLNESGLNSSLLVGGIIDNNLESLKEKRACLFIIILTYFII